MEAVRRDPAVIFRSFFRLPMSPLTARDIQAFFRVNGTLISSVVDRCRISSSPKDVFMLIKRGEEWVFVLGTDARFNHPDLINRSHCTKAWGYFGNPPDFKTVRDRTAVFELKRGILDGVRNPEQVLGTLLITDPPLLPLTLFIFEAARSTLSGVPHDLSLPEALQFAPEMGGCKVSLVGFAYTNADLRFRFGDRENGLTFVYPFVHYAWPPVWASISTADRYYLVETIIKTGHKHGFPINEDNTLKWHVEIPPAFQDFTIEDVERNTAGRTVTALSTTQSYTMPGSLMVSVFNPQIPHQTVDATDEDISECTEAYRDIERPLNEFYEPLEAQEIARSHVVVAKPLDEEEKIPSRPLNPICKNTRELITMEDWDEVELNPADPREAIVTLFYEPEVRQGYCYRLDYLLKSLRSKPAYKWVGNFKFGYPDHTSTYYYLLGLSVWLDRRALDQLELSGSRFFALQSVGTEKLGHRSGSIQAVNTNVFTLVPLTKRTAAEYLDIEEARAIEARAEEPQAEEPQRAKRPRAEQSSVSPDERRTRFSDGPAEARAEAFAEAFAE